MGRPEDEASSVARAWRAAAPWLDATWQFVGSAMVGVALGYGADVALETKPYGLALGGLLGSAMGFWVFIRTSLRLLDKK